MGEQMYTPYKICEGTIVRDSYMPCMSSVSSVPYLKDDFYSKNPTKIFFYFLPICSLQYA